jgi:magnesium-protoporphyrin IX monomethyl ester (oxidative) cyclase
MTPDEYDMRVLRITADICRQVFPVTLDVDRPGFKEGLQRLFEISEKMAAAKAEGGLGGRAKRFGLGLAAGATFLRLYLMPGRKAALPADVRLAPAW